MGLLSFGEQGSVPFRSDSRLQTRIPAVEGAQVGTSTSVAVLLGPAPSCYPSRVRFGAMRKVALRNVLLPNLT